MASFDTDAYDDDAFEFTAFSIDFNLDLQVDADTLATYPVALQYAREIVTNAPDALVATPHNAIIGLVAFDELAFDTLTAFDTDAFASAITPGVALDATKQTLSLTSFATTINAASVVNATQQSLSVTTYPVTLDFGGILTSANALTLTEHQVSLIIDDEWIPAADVLTLTPHPPSISKSFAGSTDNLTLTTYPVGLAIEIPINVGVDTLLLVAPQVASIEYTGVTIVGTSKQSLTVTTYPVTINSGEVISVGKQGLSVSPQTATIEFSANIGATSIPLTVTTYPAIIGFDWHATMKVDNLYIGIPRMTVGENNVDIWQPIPDDLDEDVVNHF